MNVKYSKLGLFTGQLLIIGLFALGFNLLVEDITRGVPRIIDADSISINGQNIRLSGIDAPEPNQTCKLKEKNEVIRCGQLATEALTKKVDGEAVQCVGDELDIYDRLLAVCFHGKINLNEWLVLNGWALAYTRYSREYLAAQNKAQSEELGIWKYDFETPEDWRREH